MYVRVAAAAFLNSKHCCVFPGAQETIYVIIFDVCDRTFVSLDCDALGADGTIRLGAGRADEEKGYTASLERIIQTL